MKSTLPAIDQACEAAIRRWCEDRADPQARQHIDSCSCCKDFIDGDDGSAVETMRSLMEEIRGTDRIARRRKFLYGVAGAVLLCISSFGVGAYAERSQPSVYNRIEQDLMLGLDRVYSQGGVSAVQNLLTVATKTQKKEILYWIAHRQHSPLYGELVLHASHTDKNVAMVAFAGICSVSPTDLTSHVAGIQTLANNESDVNVQAALQDVVQAIQNP